MAQRARGAAAGARPAGRSGQRRDQARDRAENRPDNRPQVDLSALRNRLRALAEPVVTAAGLDLEELSVIRAGRRYVVRVTVDADQGIGHDELTDVSRELSAVLDEAEQSGGELAVDSYTLELSSPGVDRPLTLPRHWRRNIGRLVVVRAGDRTVTARIAAVDEAGVTFDPAVLADPVPFDRLGAGKVQVEFTRLADLADDEIGDAFDDDDEADDENDEDENDEDEDDDSTEDDDADDGSGEQEETP